MAIVTQTDKRTGITYAYETVYFWDKTKQQSRAKRTCIGKVDPLSGEIVPTRKKRLKSDSKNKKRDCASYENAKHLYYGATYLLESLSDSLGLTTDLKSCFPNTYKQLLSIAFFLILENNQSLHRFEKWHLTHYHPSGENISSHRSSELFTSITDDQVHQFFKMQDKRRIQEKYWAYVSTSFSSYSETINQLHYIENREEASLPQLNLLLVFGEESALPFYYRKLSGNIQDEKTVKKLRANLDILGFKDSKFVMDQRFYSEDNITRLLDENIKFLIEANLSVKFIKSNLDIVYDHIRMPYNYDGSHTYGYTVTAEWDNTKNRVYKKDNLKENRRIYIHYYYDIEKGAAEEQAFDQDIYTYAQELISGKTLEQHQSAYDQFFEVKTTSKRERKVFYKEDAIKAARRYFGYYAVITNEKIDAFTALHLYRKKDIVDKAFGNLKERLNMKRILTSSERSLKGKIFTEFVALILISHLDHLIRKTDLYKQYSLNLLLDMLDVIELFKYPDSTHYIEKIINNKAKIYETLGIAIPT